VKCDFTVAFAVEEKMSDALATDLHDHMAKSRLRSGVVFVVGFIVLFVVTD
jgi:uncharacterized protein YaaW (UPF0174 family)